MGVTALFTVFGGSSRLGLSYQDIFEKFRIWKLIISNFAFSSTPELFIGLYFLYYFRVLERQIGSTKHSVFILFSGFVTLILEAILLSLFKDPTANLLTSGPFNHCKVLKLDFSVFYHFLEYRLSFSVFIG